VSLCERRPGGDVDAGFGPQPADVRSVDLGTTGLDIGEVAPRDHVDVADAGFSGKIADLGGGVRGSVVHKAWCKQG
jgi:hypothetical protein